MAEKTIELVKGLVIDNVAHTKAVLREATAGDIIDASTESERIIQADLQKPPQLVVSNTLLGMNMLRRQIVKIGDIEGPLSLTQMKLLSGTDLGMLQDGLEELEEAAFALELRGRDSASSE